MVNSNMLYWILCLLKWLIVTYCTVFEFTQMVNSNMLYCFLSLLKWLIVACCTVFCEFSQTTIYENHLNICRSGFA